MVLGFLRDLLGAPRPETSGTPGLHAQASFTQLAMRGSGPGVLGLWMLTGPNVQTLAGGRILLTPFVKTSTRIPSRFPEFADNFGNIWRESRPLIFKSPGIPGVPPPATISPAPPMIIAEVFTPFAAFPDPNARVNFMMLVQNARRETLGRWTYEGFQLEADKHDRLNVLAAVCDAWVAATRLTKPLERQHVARIKEALTAIYMLDDHGLVALRRYLKRADQTNLNDKAFSAENLAQAISRFVQPADHLGVVEFLLQLAGGDGSAVSEATFAFVSRFGARMGLHPRAMREMFDRYRPKPENARSSEGSRKRTKERPNLRAPHEILGLSQGASTADIKSAYRSLVKKYHPDVAGTDDLGARLRFLEVQRAYETLIGEAAA